MDIGLRLEFGIKTFSANPAKVRQEFCLKNTTSKFQIVFGPKIKKKIFGHNFLGTISMSALLLCVVGAAAVLLEGQNTVIHVGIEKDKSVALKMTQ